MPDALIMELTERYPQLECCVTDLRRAFAMLRRCYQDDHVVYICGNGGSAADAEHIVGELMKSFSRRRPISEAFARRLAEPKLACRLEGALRAIALTGQLSLSTAFANDVSPELVFAQQVFGYGRPGDVLWALSTSGNASNVLQALRVAPAREMFCLGLTGKSGGAMAQLCDVCICVPETETYKIQELHLPVYHALCRMLEVEFFHGQQDDVSETNRGA